MYLDLEELPELFDGAWLWSYERFNVASFRRRHFLGDAHVPLIDTVRARVRAATGQPVPRGPVRLLTHLGFVGYCFNPVSFYYLYEEDGQTLHSVTAEITNTPWRERFQYVLLASAAERRGEHWVWSFEKEFHVSPFFDMNHRYEWAFNLPGPRLEVAMSSFVQPEDHAGGSAQSGDRMTRGSDGAPNMTDGSRVFDASLVLERRPFERRELRRCLARHPFMTGKVQCAIHWQALRLWLRRTPFVPHPKHRARA